MLSILADLNSGDVGTFEVPSPELRAGGLLVRTAFSAISAGTERSTIETGKKSLVGKALARPDLVKQVLNFAKTNGAKAAYRKVQTRLNTFACLGYSCSGTVLATADGVTEFQPGDRVACAGAGYASHSEINFVPRNLVAKIPDAVSLEAACLTTVGAIAMQGLRQAQVCFGETVVVVGAGLVGVLTIQLARAAGCRVVAIDANPSRAEMASEVGAGLRLTTSDASLLAKVMEFTKYGADAAIIAAGSSSVEPVELAARVLRDRGRIVVVGAVPLGVSRETMYRKELSLVLSRSYGPGRYDPNYEDLGNDYPIGYVRWTEQRNMESFLEFLSTGAVDVAPLLRLQFGVEQGAQAYYELERSEAYTAIVKYDPVQSAPREASPNVVARARVPGDLRIGCIGAGSFARSIIFPQLQTMKGVRLETVGTASGVSAFSAQKNFHFHRAQQASELLASPDVDAVFVLSHHDSHAGYVLSGLSQQKPVFVEKPLATRPEELDAIRDAYQAQIAQGHSPFVMVGFNRRFSSGFEKVHDFFAGRREPMVVHVRVNAGYLPREHWTQQDGNGGRIVGEVCHFLDWIRALVGRNIVRVHAMAVPDGARYNRDNLAVTVAFADGSLGNILYLANGDKALPKEFYEVFCEGAVARLDDYRSLELLREEKSRRFRLERNKGHRKELELTVRAIREGGSAPIPFEELTEVTEASFAVGDSLRHGLPVNLRTYQPAQTSGAQLCTVLGTPAIVTPEGSAK